MSTPALTFTELVNAVATAKSISVAEAEAAVINMGHSRPTPGTTVKWSNALKTVTASVP